MHIMDLELAGTVLDRSEGSPYPDSSTWGSFLDRIRAMMAEVAEVFQRSRLSIGSRSFRDPGTLLS